MRERGGAHEMGGHQGDVPVEKILRRDDFGVGLCLLAIRPFRHGPGKCRFDFLGDHAIVPV